MESIFEYRSKTDVDGVELYVAFYILKKSGQKHFKNVLAKAYTGSRCTHCEFFFPETGETFSVDSLRPCYLVKDKKYEKGGWKFVELRIPRESYDNLYAFCRDHVGEGFDMCSLISHPFPVGCCSSPRTDKWICSRICVAALQAGRILTPDVDLHSVSPYELRKKLETDCGYFIKTIEPTEAYPTERIRSLKPPQAMEISKVTNKRT